MAKIIIDHATGHPAAPIIDSSTGEPITCKCCKRVFTTHKQMTSEYAGNDYWHLICRHRSACYARAKQTLLLQCSHCQIPISTLSHLDRWKWSAGQWEHHCVQLGIDPGYWPAEAIPQADDKAIPQADNGAVVLFPTTNDAAAWWYLDSIAADLAKASREHRYHPPEVFAHVTRWLMHYFADIGLSEDEAIGLIRGFSDALAKAGVA